MAPGPRPPLAPGWKSNGNGNVPRHQQKSRSKFVWNSQRRRFGFRRVTLCRPANRNIGLRSIVEILYRALVGARPSVVWRESRPLRSGALGAWDSIPDVPMGPCRRVLVLHGTSIPRLEEHALMITGVFGNIPIRRWPLRPAPCLGVVPDCPFMRLSHDDPPVQPERVLLRRLRTSLLIYVAGDANDHRNRSQRAQLSTSPFHRQNHRGILSQSQHNRTGTDRSTSWR